MNKIQVKVFPIKIKKAIIKAFLLAFILCVPTIQASAESGQPMLININDFSKEVAYEVYSKWFNFYPSLKNDPTYYSEIENINFCFEKEFFCALTYGQRTRIHTKKIALQSMNTNEVRQFLKELKEESKKTPANAKFKMEEEKISLLAMEKNGFSLDVEKSLEKIESTFKDEKSLKGKLALSLPYNEEKPDIKSSDIDRLGINTLLGQGKSNFKGSTKSRIHNIEVATQRYDGYLLAPGAEFSFVEALGPVDGENGYLPELVIKNDRTEPEFGGGICQVSTTAFRAAIYSGLEITARKNHAYAVQYYSPHGMDATIYIPKPDLKFKNNTPGYILMQTQIEGTELVFSFFGTSDNRKIEVDGPRIIEKNSDGSMKTTFTQKVYDKNENIIIDEAFNSFYDSPSKYPHPGEEIFTEKPKDWSKKQWDTYKKVNSL